MCRIYYAKNMKGKAVGKQYIDAIRDIAVSESAINPDGWGYAIRNGDEWRIKKGKLKFVASDFKVAGASEIILHLRKSTGGAGIDNTQPITNDGWTLIHNGIVSQRWALAAAWSSVNDYQAWGESISDYQRYGVGEYKVDNSGVVERQKPYRIQAFTYKEPAESDTKLWLKDIVKIKGEAWERIKASLRDRSGSYSCFLIAPDGRVFYFKSAGTTFRFELYQNTVVGMTTEDYFRWIRQTKYGAFQIKPPSFTPAPKTIYEIGNEITYAGQSE